MQLLSAIFPVFALVLIGWVGQRRHLLSAEAFHGLRDIVYFLAMPALLFSAIAEGPALDLVAITSVYFAACLSIFAGAFVLARLLRLPQARAAMLALNASYGNTVMVGIPVVLATLGQDALPPLMAIIALHAAILLPLAGTLIAMDGAKRNGRSALTVLVGTGVATLRNPIIAAIAIAFIWRGLHAPTPKPMAELLSMLGACSTPLALICLGGSLPPLHARALDAEAAAGIILKIVLLPALVWTLGRWADLPILPLRVAVLVAAMPTGANAFLLARKDESLAEVSAATVVTTTMLAPLSLWILLQFLM